MKDKNSILMKFISTQGYKNSSPDVNNPINVIPSNRITMKDVDFPVYGVDNLGNSQVMMPGEEYLFGGDYVVETPINKQWGGTFVNPLIPIVAPLVAKAYNYFTGDSDPTDLNYNKPVKDVRSMTPYERANAMYMKRSMNVSNKLQKNDAKNYDQSAAITLTSGRFNGAKVSPQMVDDIVKAARANNVDPWVMLSLVGRESTFGSGTESNKVRANNRQNLVSGWDVAQEYQPYEFDRFLADNKVPGITVQKDNHGWYYNIEDQKTVDQYLQKHPELIEKYNQKLQSTPILGNEDSFGLAAKRIKTTGIQNYNPGDPRYQGMVTQDMQLLKKDPALVNYMKSKGYYKEEGGQTNNDREMVEGIADILSQVKDPKNRNQIAQNMIGDFKRENVKYNLNEFLNMAGVMKKGGEMIKRADGSYSQRGFWDNIRDNAGSGKKPTKEMLEQERKIRMQDGGEPETNSLSPQDLDNWNQFVKYAKKSGAAADERYNHDKKLGYELIKKYNQENPNAAIDSKKVKDYQSYFLNMAAGNTASGQMGVKTANSFKNGISRADGFLGLKTLNQMVPKVSTEINGVRTDYGSDFASANRNFAAPVAQSQQSPFQQTQQRDNLKKFVNYDNATAQQQQAFDEAMLARKKQELAAQVRKPVATSGNPNNPANYQEFLASGESWAPAPDGGFYVKQYGGEMQPQQQEPEESQKTGNIDDALGEISMMLEGGTNPDEILKMLMEQGLSEEQGQDIIQSAMNDVTESDMEEEDVPLDTEDIEDTSSELLESDDEMKYGGIKIDPRKKGTFKAQATKMGMSVQEAAEHILNNKEEYSPEMVKKANFAKNFAKELGGQLYEMAEGGTIPSRYKNMGFTKVGVKKQSTRPGKKWMVLAKKGDQYKVVHGGWKGMQDFKQHGSEKRKDRFWDRMGGRDSAKAKDPFSPLYWHKRFGTWQEGGESTDPAYNYDNYMAGDQRTDVTESHTLNSLKNNSWNRGLAAANSLGDPRSMVWALPNKGLLGTIKGIAGAAAGLSGAVLGYEKLFAKPKTTEYVVNPETQESGKLQDVIQARKEKQDAIMKDWSSPEMYQDSPLNEKRRKDNMIPSGPMGPGDFDGGYPSGPSYENLARYGGTMRRYQDGGDTPLTYDEWMAQNGRGLMGEEGRDMNDYQQYLAGFKAANTPATATSVGGVETAQTPGGNAQPGTTSPTANEFTQTKRGDTAGIVAANNALAGLGMVNQVLGAKDYQKEYEQRLRETGNTMNRYNPQNAVNPFGNYTLNAGPASNFGLVANTPIQDFGTKMSSARYGGLIPFIPATRHYAEGGEFYADEEEIKRILAMGGEIEYLD